MYKKPFWISTHKIYERNRGLNTDINQRLIQITGYRLGNFTHQSIIKLHLGFMLLALIIEQKQSRRELTNLDKFPKSSTSLSSPLPGLPCCWVRLNSLTIIIIGAELVNLTHCGKYSCQIYEYLSKISYSIFKLSLECIRCPSSYKCLRVSRFFFQHLHTYKLNGKFFEPFLSAIQPPRRS